MVSISMIQIRQTRKCNILYFLDEILKDLGGSLIHEFYHEANLFGKGCAASTAQQLMSCIRLGIK